MTVEAYLRSLVMGINFPSDVLDRCMMSVSEVGLEPISLSANLDDIEDENPDYQMVLDYASSTLYYSVLGVFTGGGYSEQVGNVRISQSRSVITQSDRERYKSLGDSLRRKWGFAVEENLLDESGMFDASSLRQRPKTPNTYYQ